ncbi:MAG: box helicase domain protein [Fibrobacteres bacterium]|nr:box helicase domain protein [Fibrobacterota bacterium]
MPSSTATTFKDILETLPREYRNDNDFLLTSFLDWAALRGLSIYPAQEAAVLELFEGKNVILNTPTGSGKSLVASVLHFQALAQGRRSVYTCPIKALVNEKWLALCKEFGPENVGLSTGDATVNRDAPILCCTAEILSNMALSEGADCPVRDVVMDEFHYYSDRDRGVAWQIPLLSLNKARFLLMSATLGETAFFEEALTKVTGLPTVTVKSQDRPVPLTFQYCETALAETVLRFATEGRAPVYVVHFTQADAARNAQSFTSLDLCNKEEKNALASAMEGFRFTSPYGPDLKRWLRQGIGLHHAGLLPKYRILVEKLAQQGLLKVICGTDTLGVGVNVPIRTVLFTQLCKYSGDKTAILTARDFHQISGRAGRKGFDDAGFVAAQAPEHVVENLKLAAKTAQSGRKFVKRQPPEKGYVPWDEATFKRLIVAQPERLVSRFQVTHGMLLNVLGRPGDGCRAMRELISESHESAKDKAAHRKRAFQLFRSLVERGIVEITPLSERASGRPKLRVNVDLQQNFSMDQTLSLYLLDTLSLLDKEAPEHPMDLLTLVESILEDPDLVLRRQLDMLKTERMIELKAQGVEFDQRVAELDAMEHPKPLREFVYSTFNAFTEKHPWVGGGNIRPKSIAREMLEGYYTFSGYIKRYGLERSEGLLLRHLNSVYKVLANTIPEAYKTDPVREMVAFFGDLVRRVDSSLLEEWERLMDPDFRPAEVSEPLPPGAEEAARAAERDITLDEKGFTAAIRARVFSFLASLARYDFPGAFEALTEGLGDAGAAGQTAVAAAAAQARAALAGGEDAPWTEERLRKALEDYRAEHGPFRLDPEGRAPRHTVVEKDPEREWRVSQYLQDHDGHNDWKASFAVDLDASRLSGAPVLRLTGFTPAGQ